MSRERLAGLAGEVYRLYAEGRVEDVRSPEEAISFKAINRAVAEGRIKHASPIIPGKPG